MVRYWVAVVVAAVVGLRVAIEDAISSAGSWFFMSGCGDLASVSSAASPISETSSLASVKTMLALSSPRSIRSSVLCGSGGASLVDWEL
jgi:hypothetical protein